MTEPCATPTATSDAPPDDALASADAPRGGSVWRLVALALALAGTFVLGRITGATEHLSAEGLRELVEGAGAVGVVGFVVLFVVGELLHVPGLVFIGAAVALWGPARGGAIAGVGALLSLATSFVVVRAIGGTPLGAVKSGLARRILRHLDVRPVVTVAAVRAVFILSPPVTYALALSGIRFRDYFVGSAVGLAPPLLVAVLVFDCLARR